MPIFTRYSENDVLFLSLFTKKILKDFLETFFTARSNQVTRAEEMKQALDPSFYYSSDQFQTDICKVLNLICRFFDYEDIESSCPGRDIERVNKFLSRCSRHTKSPLLKEWAIYTQTSLFVRIITNLPEPSDSDHTVFLLNMIETSTEKILRLILQHGPHATFKAILHKTFRNIF
jgi:hypothetical protein